MKEPTNMDEIEAETETEVLDASDCKKEVSTIPGTQVINKWNLKHMQRNFQKHKMI